MPLVKLEVLLPTESMRGATFSFRLAQVDHCDRKVNVMAIRAQVGTWLFLVLDPTIAEEYRKNVKL